MVVGLSAVVSVAVTVAVVVTVGVVVTVAEGEGVNIAVGVSVPPLGVRVDVGVPRDAPDGVLLGVRVGTFVVVIVGSTVGLAGPKTVGLGVAESVGIGGLLGVNVASGVGSGLGVSVSSGDIDGVGLAGSTPSNEVTATTSALVKAPSTLASASIHWEPAKTVCTTAATSWTSSLPLQSASPLSADAVLVPYRSTIR